MFVNRGKHKKENVLLDKTPDNNSVYFCPSFVCLSWHLEVWVLNLWLFFFVSVVNKKRIISSDLLVTLGHQHILWH